jgi:hypothetical protein
MSDFLTGFTACISYSFRATRMRESAVKSWLYDVGPFSKVLVTILVHRHNAGQGESSSSLTRSQGIHICSSDQRIRCSRGKYSML